MRKLLCLVLLTACELQPAPKKQPPAATPPAAAPSAPKAPSLPEEGSAAAPKAEISEVCKPVASKIVGVYLDGVTDPSQKRVLEQERANLTRKVGEACTLQGWSDAARGCYLDTKTPADVKACETKFSPPPAPQPPPPTEG